MITMVQCIAPNVTVGSELIINVEQLGTIPGLINLVTSNIFRPSQLRKPSQTYSVRDLSCELQPMMRNESRIPIRVFVDNPLAICLPLFLPLLQPLRFDASSVNPEFDIANPLFWTLVYEV